ncbi:peptidoglycan editing factor PgeF [Chlamydia sp.]|uniref:peptidoglycan editing factor PgeF n=1 Tax=Chlamydia sp. TaxID=35827 RepID=UPI0025C33BF0|nr:peptidoglycan editing factor PgeF [Chlamydia sp.]MBQ8498422.1 peptidoglycan editing factor PgeF [Chlamydia sp.]
MTTQSQVLRIHTFPELEHFPIRHGVFPKQNDEEHACQASDKVISSYLGGDDFCNAHQVHSTSLRYVTHKTPKRCPADGLLTDIPLLSLHIYHADCQAAIFYDPEHHVIADVHAGWRGLVGNIYAVTVRLLKKRFGSDPRDLIVAIAPSLGPDMAIYPDYKQLFPSSFFLTMPQENHLDFRAVARNQLLAEGLLKNHIFISERCTCSESDVFFSFRGWRSHHQNHPLVTRPRRNNVTAVLLLPR